MLGYLNDYLNLMFYMILYFRQVNISFSSTENPFLSFLPRASRSSQPMKAPFYLLDSNVTDKIKDTHNTFIQELVISAYIFMHILLAQNECIILSKFAY